MVKSLQIYKKKKTLTRSLMIFFNQSGESLFTQSLAAIILSEIYKVTFQAVIYLLILPSCTQMLKTYENLPPSYTIQIKFTI